MSAKPERTKLNKETLEASLIQIEYLKGLKKEQMTGLIKMLDNKCTAEELEEFERLYKSLDTEEKNEIPASQLGTCLRILGQVPTDNEVEQLLETVNPKKDDAKKNSKQSTTKPDAKASKTGEEEEVPVIDFFKFLLALGLYIRDPSEIADEVKAAFKVLDRRNAGYLMAGDIRDFLSKLGDVLTDEEIDEMIKLADVEMNGQIKYEEVSRPFSFSFLLIKSGSVLIAFCSCLVCGYDDGNAAGCQEGKEGQERQEGKEEVKEVDDFNLAVLCTNLNFFFINFVFIQLQ